MLAGEERREALALRYQVYCLERSFLPPELFPIGQEFDEYDEASQAVVARYDGMVVGHVRLVRSLDRRFPFQEHCGIYPDVRLHHGAGVEISRLAISKSRVAVFGTDGDVTLPTGVSVRWRNAIVLCLFKAILQQSVRHGWSVWYAAMEKSLSRMLQRIGINFEPIGDEVDYYGPVSPYAARIPQVLNGINATVPALHRWFCDEAPPAIGGVSA